MWQLDYICAEKLPRLGWAAVLRRHESRIEVQHGPWLEVNNFGFVEGAWSGLYSEMGFAEATTFTGSGGLVTPAGLLLATPTHTSECLYMLRQGRTMFCSNNLIYLLMLAEDDIDLGYQYYDIDIMAAASRAVRGRSRIPTRFGNEVELHYYANVLVDANLSVSVLSKKRFGTVSTYRDYYTCLQSDISATIENAGDWRRTRQYAPLATVSTGYDSTASAVLARAAGCRDAVSFRTAHDERGIDVCDSGKQIGELLGMQVTEYEQDAYRARRDCPEAEFLATGAGGGGVQLTALEERLTGRLLLTGYYGDPAWDRVDNTGGDNMLRLDPSPGSDLIYYRSRIGFLHLPVPSIGFVEHRSILALSNAAEMRPWSLGRDSYDRPIPRRLVEEAGIPRELFGQTKKIAARPQKLVDVRGLLSDPDLRDVMAPASYLDFERWVAGRQPSCGWWQSKFWFCMHKLYRLNTRALRTRIVREVAGRVHVGLARMPWIPSKYGRSWTPHRLLFHWGVERVRSQYSGWPARDDGDLNTQAARDRQPAAEPRSRSPGHAPVGDARQQPLVCRQFPGRGRTRSPSGGG
jgi:hypothetical protein